jgi:alpha-D-ribose 1-methylphosphonate 5-triphosphate synthase subunit PhnL
MDWLLKIENLHKSFCLHAQGRTRIPVLKNFCLMLCSGESVALVGPSGAGKSTILRLLYGNYKTGSGNIWVRHKGLHVNISKARPHEILDVRKWTVGYISQFLRVIPRVPALSLVMEPLLSRGISETQASRQARHMLCRLNIPERLWSLSPTTFSGGEQQRINIARGFIAEYPIMVLDEPTASLDPDNATTVMQLMDEARQRGTAMVGIFHDPQVRRQAASRMITIAPPADRN